MCWAKPSDASKSCAAALLAAKRESERLRSLGSNVQAAQGSAARAQAAASQETRRLQELLGNVRADRSNSLDVTRDSTPACVCIHGQTSAELDDDSSSSKSYMHVA